MQPKREQPTEAQDLFRARLDQFINMRHELVLLARRIDWAFLHEQLAPCFSEKGRPGLPVRFMAGLSILKDVYGLSDEEVCARWVCDPYFQYFTGEEFFQHVLPHERQNLSNWRKRCGDNLAALIQESLKVAHDAGALKLSDLGRVTVDTTVQPKNVTHPTDAKLMLTAIRKLAALAREEGVRLRQSFVRVAKRAALMAGRYAHAKQFKRMNRELRLLRTRLGRLIRDIVRKIAGDFYLETIFAEALAKAERIKEQRQNARGPKIYSWHAPETECIGKGKAHKPYEFGVKAAVVTTNRRSKGGMFVLHAKALPGAPYDGHTLAGLLDETAAATGRAIERAYVDKGFRGHGIEKPGLRVYISGQKRGVHGQIRRELRRRSGIEPVIGHMKSDGRMGRCYLKGAEGDAINVILAAAGHNFRAILAWLRALLHFILAALPGALGQWLAA